MIKATPEKELEVKYFMKEAWAIDGDVEFITNDEARDLLKTHNLNVMKLTDSKRGIFYVGTFKEKDATGKIINGVRYFDPSYRCHICGSLATEETRRTEFPVCYEHK